MLDIKIMVWNTSCCFHSIGAHSGWRLGTVFDFLVSDYANLLSVVSV